VVLWVVCSDVCCLRGIFVVVFGDVGFGGLGWMGF